MHRGGDSQRVPAEGVSATKRMISFDKLPAIIGDVCSSITLAMQLLAEEAGVLLVNAALPASTARAVASSIQARLVRITAPTIEVPLALCRSDHLPMSEPARAVRSIILELVDALSAS